MMKRATTILLLAIAALAFAGVASAQGDNGGSAGQQKTQQLLQQYRAKAVQLQKIHQKTIKNNPQLAAEQDKFEKQVRQAIKNQGYDLDKGQQRIQKMAQKLQSGKLSDAERKAAMKDFQAERQQLIKARDAALQQPKIQQRGKKLEQDTITAMKKQDNNTAQLLKNLQSLRSQLRATMPAPPAQSSNKD